MPQVVDDAERRTRNDLGGVLGVYRGAELVCAPVQDDDGTGDCPDVECLPSRAIRKPIVGVAGRALCVPFPCPTLPNGGDTRVCDKCGVGGWKEVSLSCRRSPTPVL